MDKYPPIDDDMQNIMYTLINDGTNQEVDDGSQYFAQDVPEEYIAQENTAQENITQDNVAEVYIYVTISCVYIHENQNNYTKFCLSTYIYSRLHQRQLRGRVRKHEARQSHCRVGTLSQNSMRKQGKYLEHIHID